jgi:hypothetical protein
MIAWILLALIGLFNVFASVSDFIATRNTGLPSDHTGTFTKAERNELVGLQGCALGRGQLHHLAGARICLA